MYTYNQIELEELTLGKSISEKKIRLFRGLKFTGILARRLNLGKFNLIGQGMQRFNFFSMMVKKEEKNISRFKLFQIEFYLNVFTEFTDKKY